MSSLKGSTLGTRKSHPHHTRMTFFHYFFCIGLGTLEIIKLAPKMYQNGVVMEPKWSPGKVFLDFWKTLILSYLTVILLDFKGLGEAKIEKMLIKSRT